MKAPVRERIVVFRYKRLEVEVYRKICDALGPYLCQNFPNEKFTEERLNSPEVTIPLQTVGDQEPDWSQLKVSIDRPSRFWNEARTRCVQFFRDYLTLNCIVTNASNVGTYGDLEQFLKTVLPFLAERSDEFKIETASIDYENQLGATHLKNCLTNDGRTLELQRLFKCFVAGPAISGTSFVTPLNQKITWEGQSAEVPWRYRLTETIDVPSTQEVGGWHVRVLLSAASAQFPGMDSSSVVQFFAGMHKVIRDGFAATFTQTVLDEIGGLA